LAVSFDCDSYFCRVHSTGGVELGILRYDGREFEFDDRILMHLQVVISTKLRRKEDFFLTWSLPRELGSGRHAVWIDNGVPIHFFYSGSRDISINREWLESLIASAGRASGLLLTNELPPSR